MTTPDQAAASTPAPGAETGTTTSSAADPAAGTETTTSTSPADADAAGDGDGESTIETGAAESTVEGGAAEDKPEDKPQQTAEEIAAAEARAKVPAEGESYALNLPEGLDRFFPDGEKDVAVAALFKGAQAAGWTQGKIDDAIGAMKILADQGVLPVPFDAKAQLELLGENGSQRRADVETYAQSLLARGDIDKDEFAVLTSVAPEAAGVRLIEKMRKWMADDKGKIDVGDGKDPGAVDAEGKTAGQREADAMSQDPRYRSDHRYKAEADRKWIKEYGE